MYGGEKLDTVVGDEQALVAVAADQQLGRDVAKQMQHSCAVNESAGVMGIVRADAQTYQAGQFLHGDLLRLSFS
jgi:hypothetical protein